MFLRSFFPLAEAFIELLGAVLGSVEALLCRQKVEAWQSQDLPGPPHAGPPDTRECDQQAESSQVNDTNMRFTQVTQRHLFHLLHYAVFSRKR